jgi:hypothetical protein
MKEKMSKLGKTQGDMSPCVEEMQIPESSFSQKGFSNTLDYIERKDKHCKMAASKIRSQDYKGRYD